MSFGIAVARIIHVLGGVIWVGSMFFVSVFLIPAMTEAGPDAAKVSAALNRRNWMVVVPIIALLTIFSGPWLYWRASSGFNPAYMSSGPGKAYGTGAALAITGFLIGIIMTRPAMMKAEQLSREGKMAEAQAYRARGARWGKIIGFFLIGAATMMALGRYV
jgi:uncharacterized membrane protein